MNNYNDTNIWFPFTQMKTADAPLQIEKAKDALLFDENGKSYIDANSSWWVNVHGHGNSHIQQKINEQFQRLDHVLLAGVAHPPAKELSARLCDLFDQHFQKVFFSDDGSTAVEVALKMCFQYFYNQGEERKRVLALEGAYHGDTFGAMSVGQRGYFNKPFEHFFFDVDFLEFPTEDKEEDLLKQANELFSSNEFACVILEPLVQGSAGMRMYRKEFLQELTALAHRHGVKVIFDEIMTGWGRTGEMFSMNHIEAKPDVICLSKGLTGGVLPMGLTLATDEIFQAFWHDDKTKALLHGHSYTGNPLACAAACASLDLFEQAESLKNRKRIEKSHAVFIEEMQGNDKITEIRQQGTILRLEIKLQEESSYFASIRDDAYRHFLQKGILLRPLGNILFLNPPYCITDEQLNQVYNAMREFVDSRS